jgi:alkyl hydroperoxide reductase subunit AhpF
VAVTQRRGIDLAGPVKHVTWWSLPTSLKADATASLSNVIADHTNAQTTEITGDGQSEWL